MARRKKVTGSVKSTTSLNKKKSNNNINKVKDSSNAEDVAKSSELNNHVDNNQQQNDNNGKCNNEAHDDHNYVMLSPKKHYKQSPKTVDDDNANATLSALLSLKDDVQLTEAINDNNCSLVINEITCITTTNNTTTTTSTDDNNITTCEGSTLHSNNNNSDCTEDTMLFNDDLIKEPDEMQMKSLEENKAKESSFNNIFSNSITFGGGGGIPFIDDAKESASGNWEESGSNSSGSSSSIRRSNRIRSKSKKMDVYWNASSHAADISNDINKNKDKDKNKNKKREGERNENEIIEKSGEENEIIKGSSTSLVVPYEAQTTFEIINENEYRIERVVSREAKKMFCDCLLTKEEVGKGEFGCGEDCLNRLLLIECGPRCLLGERCSNKRFQYGQYAKCDVYKTEKKGFGLRSLDNIPQGAFIMEYVGEVVDMKEFKKRAKGYSKDKNAHYYFMSLKSDCVIDATNRGNISRFINHSCDPNAETQKWTVLGELRIGFFTKRAIAAGEEVTFDYKYQRYGREAQKCFCEASTCRGWIGEQPDDDEEGEDNEDLDEEEEEEEESEDEDEQVQQQTNNVEKKEEEIEGGRNVKKKRRVTRKKRIEKEEGYYDWERTLERIMKTGLIDRHQTLNLNRLMLHAKGNDARLNILKLIEGGDNACKRLFVDYHGLQILYTWMTHHNQHKQLRLQVLKTLISLPVINRTIVIDRKILPLAKKWAQDEEEEEQVVQLANKICAEWATLNQAYRIPKKERIEQMKEHEREADEISTTYKTQVGHNSPNMTVDMAQVNEARKRKEQPVLDLYDGIYRKRRYDDKIRMSKSQYRKMFERKVAIEEIRKKREEEEKQLLCQQQNENENESGNENVGIMFDGDGVYNNMNLYAMPPPTCNNNNNMQPVAMSMPYHMQFIPPPYTTTTAPTIATQQPHTSYTIGNNIVIQPLEDIAAIQMQMPIPMQMPMQVPLVDISSQTSSTPPSLKLPKKWKCATDGEGRVYYYHVKTRVSQWFPPSQTSDSTDSSNSSSSSDDSTTSDDDDDGDDDDDDDDDDEQDDDDDINMDEDEDEDNKVNEESVNVNFEITNSDSRVMTIKMDEDMQNYGRLLQDEEKSSQDVVMETTMITGSDEENEIVDEQQEPISNNNNTSSPVAATVPVPVPVPIPLCTEHLISPTKKIDDFKRRENKRKIRELKEKLKRHKRHLKVKQQKKKNDGNGNGNANPIGDTERKIKDSFRVNMASFVVTCLNPYLKDNCTQGRITNSQDFKHLARKLTHFVMVKELKHCRDVNELTCNSSVKHKAKEFIKKYMSKFGQLYVKQEGDDNYV